MSKIFLNAAPLNFQKTAPNQHTRLKTYTCHILQQFLDLGAYSYSIKQLASHTLLTHSFAVPRANCIIRYSARSSLACSCARHNGFSALALAANILEYQAHR